MHISSYYILYQDVFDLFILDNMILNKRHYFFKYMLTENMLPCIGAQQWAESIDTPEY